MGICVSCRRRERKPPEKRSALVVGGPAKGAAAELLPRRDRLPTMANSMANIKMTNPIKNMVSKRRKRFTKDGFNLDLTYITDKVIAMGVPAEKLESVYRNSIDDVYKFLEKYHKDHYKIYNLCSEKTYDHKKFPNETVATYPFDDHTPPNLELIQPFCENVHEWLGRNEQNIAAVHCKAGKGRTGTMVCCYLLYSGKYDTAHHALKYYGEKRTHDEKGVTIPSQRRYVEYYATLLHRGLAYRPAKVQIRELVLSPPPALNGSHFTPELTLSQIKPPYKSPSNNSVEGIREEHREQASFTSASNNVEVIREEGRVRVALTFCKPLLGDVRVDVYNKPKMKMRKEKLFHFWFNTFFVASELGAQRVPHLADSPNQEAFKLTLTKWELDDAHKDKQNKLYSSDFKVELIIQKVPETSKFTGQPTQPASLHSSSSSSSCSEADTEQEGHWDSGEHIPYTRLADSNHSHDHDRFYHADDSPDSPKNSDDDSDRVFYAAHLGPLDYAPCGSAEAVRPDPEKTKTDPDDPKKKYAFFQKKDDDGLSRPRLSLGDMRASWREFSGKFGSDHRKKKSRDDMS